LRSRPERLRRRFGRLRRRLRDLLGILVDDGAVLAGDTIQGGASQTVEHPSVVGRRGFDPELENPGRGLACADHQQQALVVG
jgi:hypothetical protein